MGAVVGIAQPGLFLWVKPADVSRDGCKCMDDCTYGSPEVQMTPTDHTKQMKTKIKLNQNEILKNKTQ